MSDVVVPAWTIRDLHLASSEERGPYYEWLQRAHAAGGDDLVRAFAIELVRTVEPLRFSRPPAELLELLVAFTVDPDAHRSALRRWMASDSWFWRETTKLALDWGGATQTGNSLIRQAAVVAWAYLYGQDPNPPLAAIRERMPELPDWAHPPHK